MNTKLRKGVQRRSQDGLFLALTACDRLPAVFTAPCVIPALLILLSHQHSKTPAFLDIL
jgi:hypothetical protein